MFNELTVYQMAERISHFAHSDNCTGCPIKSKCKDNNCTLAICEYLSTITAKDCRSTIDKDYISSPYYLFPEMIDTRIRQMKDQIIDKVNEHYLYSFANASTQEQIKLYIHSRMETGNYGIWLKQFLEIFQTFSDYNVSYSDLFKLEIKMDLNDNYQLQTLLINFVTIDLLLKKFEQYREKMNQENKQMVINKLQTFVNMK